ncbi:MAG: hypothetical protein QXJ75_02425 [Candidatus Bathyarchaeia archaeon]
MKSCDSEVSDYTRALETCKDFRDVFKLVKSSVEVTLHKRRAGLMLCLADLPPTVAAYHEVGSNTLVVNRLLLKAVKDSKSRGEFNAYLYAILLHEYLHAVGYLDEAEVRRLVHLIAEAVMGPRHPATKIAADPMAIIFHTPLKYYRPTGAVELIADFGLEHQYVI